MGPGSSKSPEVGTTVGAKSGGGGAAGRAPGAGGAPGVRAPEADALSGCGPVGGLASDGTAAPSFSVLTALSSASRLSAPTALAGGSPVRPGPQPCLSAGGGPFLPGLAVRPDPGGASGWCGLTGRRTVRPAGCAVVAFGGPRAARSCRPVRRAWRALRVVQLAVPVDAEPVLQDQGSGRYERVPVRRSGPAAMTAGPVPRIGAVASPGPQAAPDTAGRPVGASLPSTLSHRASERRKPRL